MTSSSASDINILVLRDEIAQTLKYPVASSLPPLPVSFRFTREFQLLLACCSTLKPCVESIISLCSFGVDWDVFVSLVARHQVTALVYTALCQHAPAHFPGTAKEKLKNLTMNERGRALRHAAELVRLNEAFTKQQVEMIPLKGVTLSLQLFGDPAMRQAQDIDLMVRPEKLDDADRLLKVQGYKRTFPASELTPKMWRRVLLQDHHMTYCHDDLQLTVELHWSLDLWPLEHVSELWKHCEKTEWMNTTFRQLNKNALVLLLCSHGAGHMWSRLKWLSDVAILLAQERTDWNDLLGMTTELDLERALAQTALLAHWLFGIKLAEPFCTLVNKEKSSVDLASRALRVTLMTRKELSIWERFWRLTSLRYTLHLRKKLALYAHVKRIWISSAYFSNFPLPDKMFWLYYPLRPLLWICNQYQKTKMISKSAGT